MKKQELQTIIRKIQNRCYLENPTKITYYRDEEGNVIFKAFFDSLCIPKSLRLQDSDIQNTFTTQNTYEYEDNFQILSLNQDKGYVEFIPDNQHFHIIKNYTDANKAASSKEESLIVQLASKRINEDFAKAKGYILYESENIPTESNNELTKDIKVAAETGSEVIHEKNAYVIGIEAPGTKRAQEILVQALSKVPKESSSMVFLTLPKNENLKDIPSLAVSSLDAFSAATIEVLGVPKTIAYLAVDGNQECLNALKRVKLKSVTYLTDTAEKGLVQNNIAGLLNSLAESKLNKLSKKNFLEGETGLSTEVNNSKTDNLDTKVDANTDTKTNSSVDIANAENEITDNSSTSEIIHDNSAEALIPVIHQLEQKAQKFGKLITTGKTKEIVEASKKGDVLKKFEKNKEKEKGTPILDDIYGKSGIQGAKELRAEREKIIADTLKNTPVPFDPNGDTKKKIESSLVIASTTIRDEGLKSVNSLFMGDREKVTLSKNSVSTGMFTGVKSKTSDYAINTQTSDSKTGLDRLATQYTPVAETHYHLFMAYELKNSNFSPVFDPKFQALLNLLDKTAFTVKNTTVKDTTKDSTENEAEDESTDKAEDEAEDKVENETKETSNNETNNESGKDSKSDTNMNADSNSESGESTGNTANAAPTKDSAEAASPKQESLSKNSFGEYERLLNIWGLN